MQFSRKFCDINVLCLSSDLKISSALSLVEEFLLTPFDTTYAKELEDLMALETATEAKKPSNILKKAAKNFTKNTITPSFLNCPPN